MSGLLWTFPLLMFASIVIGWAAELTAVHLSAGVALAVLAWLQTAPEFAVEAVIAWNQDTHLALANLTGSLRLLLGLGWPMIFFIHWATQRKRKGAKVRDVVLPDHFAVEAVGLFVPVTYFLVIYLKGTWSLYDGILLCVFYIFYFWMLIRKGKGEVEERSDEPLVVRKILKFSKNGQYLAMFGMFAFGGLTLLFTSHAFVDSLKLVALTLGVSQFVFIQWVAPLASEFPEKVTAFQWASRPGKVPLALVNMLSSVTSQWTLLAGLVPILFSFSAGRPYTICFTDFQRTELLLTIAQTLLVVMFLSDLKVTVYEAIGLFVLWLIQFVVPSSRTTLILVYTAWIGVELSQMLLKKQKRKAFKIAFSLVARRRTS